MNNAACKVLDFPYPPCSSTPSPSKINNEKYNVEEGRDTVQPFRTKEQIEAAKQYFLTRPERYKGQNIRDWCIFVLGINLARRAGDLLHIRMHNVLDQNLNIKKHIVIREQKTGKTAKMIATPTVQEALTLYLNSLDNICLSDPLFPSRQKDKATGNKKPMTVKNLYAKLQDLKKELEIADPIGTHSLRKTWGYITAINNKDNSRIISNISKAYNHSNIETTFRYIGIEQDEIDDTFMDNQL